MDVCGRYSSISAGLVQACPKTSTLAGRVDYHGRAGKIHDAELAGMFTSEAVARPPLRRQVLHGCAQHQNLLPLNLPRADSERKKRPLLSNCRSGGGSRVPSLSPLPAGMFARNPGLVRNFEYGFESSAPDRGEWLRGRRNRRPRGATGSKFAPSSTVIYSALGCVARRGSEDSSSALRQKTDRRNQAAND